MYVLPGFSKVGSREWIFYEKLGVLGTKIQKICILRAEILAQIKAENTILLKIGKRGHMSSALMLDWKAREHRLA